MAEKNRVKNKKELLRPQNEERDVPAPSDDGGLSLNSALFMAESEDNVALKKLVGDAAPLDEELTPLTTTAKKKSYKVQPGEKQAPEKYRIEPQESKAEKAPVKGTYDPSMPQPQLGEVDVKKLYDAEPIPVLPKERTAAPKTEKAKGGAYGLGVPFAVKQPKVKRESDARVLYDASATTADEVLAQMAHNEMYLERLNAQRKRRRVLALLILGILLALLLTFGIAAIVNFTTGFTVTLSGADPNRGITLYDNSSLQNGSSYLTTDKVPESDNITYGDIRDKLLSEIDNVDGLHSLQNKYFAYTFYVVNNGNSVIDYEIAVNILSASKGMDDAVRVLVIEDTTFNGATDNKRNVVVTAKPQVDERGEWTFDENGKPVMQMLYGPNGEILAIQDNAVSFRDRTTTYYRSFKGLGNTKSRNMHKYTVMVYLEGGDPDCNNQIKGGGIKMNVEMKVTDFR